MSAESAASSQQCACSNISLMQLFHELKQKYPQVPDYIVNETIAKFGHNKLECEKRLQTEEKTALIHAYHAKSSAVAKQRQRAEGFVQCSNQVCRKQSVTLTSDSNPEYDISNKPRPFESTENENNNKIECNECLDKLVIPKRTLSDDKAIVINLDNCEAKVSHSDNDSNNELESTNNSVSYQSEKEILKPFRIKKSSKIKTGLNQKLLEKAAKKGTNKVSEEKKAFEGDKQIIQPRNQDYLLNTSQPLNFSVNVNYHMDLSPTYNRPQHLTYTTEVRPEDFIGSPSTVTSVNFTVCSPTSTMLNPIGSPHNPNDDGTRTGFQGQVTVTVNPNTPKPQPIRCAPPPPSTPTFLRPAPAPPGQALKPIIQSPDSPLTPTRSPIPESSRIVRQNKRLERLRNALNTEKVRLQKLTRETNILKSPLPSKDDMKRLRDYVAKLRDICTSTATQLDRDPNYDDTNQTSPSPENQPRTNSQDPSDIYEEAPSWQCHVCTFRNHGLLNKCEECDMPRIVVTASTGDGGVRRLSGRIETNLLLNQTDTSPEWPVNRACV